MILTTYVIVLNINNPTLAKPFSICDIFYFILFILFGSALVGHCRDVIYVFDHSQITRENVIEMILQLIIDPIVPAARALM